MKTLFLVISLVFTVTIYGQTEVTVTELKEHIKFLTSSENVGRYPGTKANRKLVKYITKDFKANGIKPLGKSYLQEFEAKLRLDKGANEKVYAKTWNVIGVIQGKDSVLKYEYIVLGAHYDHLGMGGPSSKSNKKNTIYPGADDNASGTAALLEIAEKLSKNQSGIKRSIILVAFGAEEQGLLGSRYFVNHPPVPLSQIKLMINMDMVGRMNSEKHVYMGGAGTFPDGVELMKSLGADLGLNPIVNAGSVGGSDHVSFYRKKISVLGIHTGGHPQYHTPEDTADLINYAGEKQVCEYIYQTICKVASDYKMGFILQD